MGKRVDAVKVSPRRFSNAVGSTVIKHNLFLIDLGQSSGVVIKTIGISGDRGVPVPQRHRTRAATRGGRRMAQRHEHDDQRDDDE